MSLSAGMHRSIKQIWQNVPVPRRGAEAPIFPRTRAGDAPAESADICICYMAEDVQEAVQLSETLLGESLSTWTFCCSEHPSGLWPYEVRQRLLYTDFLVVYVSPHFIHSNSQRRAVRQAAKLWHQTQIGDAYLIPVQMGVSTDAIFGKSVQCMDVATAQGVKTLQQTIFHQRKQRTTHQRIDDFEPEARRLEQCLDLSSIANSYRGSVLFTREIDGSAIQKQVRLQDSTSIAAAFSYLDYLKSKLDTPSDQLLIRFMLISMDVGQALNQSYAGQQWLTLRRIRDALERLIDELSNNTEGYAVRLGFVAIGWQQILAEIVQETAPPLMSPYHLHGSLPAEAQLFVGRESMYATLSVMLDEMDSRYQPILLHGPSGIGKSSFLNHIGEALSISERHRSSFPIVVQVESVARAAKANALLLNIAKEIMRRVQEFRAVTLPRIQRRKFEADPLGTLDDWFDAISKWLGSKSMLLVLDGFEHLIAGIKQGQYPEEVVRGLVRCLLLPRTNIKLMLASTLSLEQFSRWDHGFVNLRPLHIGVLDEEAAHQLVRNPIDHFVLQYDPAVSVRMAELTGRHPLLLQLFCNEIVAYKNEQHPASRYFVVRDDLQEVTPRLLSAARPFFAQIEEDVRNVAAIELLKTLASFEEGAIVGREELEDAYSETELNTKLAQLVALEIVEETENGFRFQIELMRRYFDQ